MLPGWQEPVGSGLLGPGELLDTTGISRLFARGTVTIEKECARHAVLITDVLAGLLSRPLHFDPVYSAFIFWASIVFLRLTYEGNQSVRQPSHLQGK